MMDTLTVILSALLIIMGVYITYLHSQLAVARRATGILMMHIMSEQEQNDDDE